MKRGRKPSSGADILDAACRVFSKKGYFRATVDDVMSAAGVGKGTVYRHFKDKEGLLVALLARMAEELGARISKCGRADRSLEENLTAIAREILEYFSSRPDLLKIFVREGTIGIPRIRKSMALIGRRFNQGLAGILGASCDMRAAAVFYGMVGEYLRRQIGIADRTVRPAKDAAYLVSMFLYGLRGAKS